MSGDARRALSGGEATLALAKLALTRAMRGKALWVAVATIGLPVLIASWRTNMKHPAAEVWESVFVTALLALPVVPSVLAGPALADEIDDKTSAYLWSRAVPRWSIVVGKLLAMATAAGLIMAAGLAAAWGIMGAAKAVPSDVALRGILAMGLVGVVGSFVVAALALLVPRQAIAVAVIYLLVDAAIGAMPFALSHVSLLFAARAIAGLHEAGMVAGLITLVALSVVSMYIALRRIAAIET